MPDKRLAMTRLQFASVIFFAVVILSFLGYAADRALKENEQENKQQTIVLVTTKDSYRLGEQVVFGVQNATDHPVIVESNCPAEPVNVYYRATATEAWRLRKSTASADCADRESRISIPAHGLRGTDLHDWQDIFGERGQYRLEITIDDQVLTKEITVE